jgi:hypothetical protein
MKILLLGHYSRTGKDTLAVILSRTQGRIFVSVAIRRLKCGSQDTVN